MSILARSWRQKKTPRSAVILCLLGTLGFASLGGCNPPLQAPPGSNYSNVYSLAFSPDGKLLATGEGGATYYPERNFALIIDVATGKELHKLQGKDNIGWFDPVAFSPDGKAIVTIGDGFGLWDVVSGKNLLRFEGRDSFEEDVPPAGAKCLAFSTDGETLIGAGFGKIAHWSMRTGKNTKLVSIYHGRSCMMISPDLRILGSAANKDRTIRLADIRTGKKTHAIAGHLGDINSIAFSPDSTMLASASKDHTVRLWDVQQGRELRTLRGHDNLVYDVAWSPDGKTLVSSAKDGTIRLWDPATGKQLRELSPPTRADRLAFSADGKKLASAGVSEILIWDMDSYKVLTTIERTPLPPPEELIRPSVPVTQ